jgi:hypothetical protein
MLSFIMLSVIMLSVIMLSVIMLIVVAPEKTLAYYKICQFSVNHKSVMFYSKGPAVASLRRKKIQ